MHQLYLHILRKVYSIGHYLAFPAILLRLLWRSRKNSDYRSRWNERFGYIKRLDSNSKSIWVHAVSVGEAIAATPLIKSLIKSYPAYKIIVTTTTPTGSKQVKTAFGKTVYHFYAPFDVANAIYRFIRRTNPKMCIIMETEMWPNLLHCLHQLKIPVLLANARLSERSKRKYKAIGNITRDMLRSYSMVSAQGLLDGERFVELGLDPKKLMISGNIKFDIQLSDTITRDGQALRQQWDTMHRPTFIAASTHEGEEEILLQAFAKIRKEVPDALMILVPRHPDRFEKVARLCNQQGYRYVLRSKHEAPNNQTNILLGDTMGELRLIYAACDVAFVGGSLIPVGGHNLIEPAALKLPVLSGPNLHNFTEISQILKQAGALQIVTDAKSIAKSVTNLLIAKELREKMGQRAQEVVISNRGALQKHLQWIEKQLNKV